ncbi:MAG: SDR family oxidoreductase, partial [Bacteroidales bacterium]|nr:SDR family oxidoreductase [Bacteroidales bacterium]
HAAGQLSRPDKDERRRRTRERQKAERQKVVQSERQARADTGIRRAREAEVFTAPSQLTGKALKETGNGRTLHSPRNCYVCKAEYTELHHFYDAMCMECAEFNYQKRFQTAPLDNQVAIITGSRLKIGYQASLMMLRAGARVIATTRFPVDSALRYSKEKDYHQWVDRLHIYGLDLRHTPSVELFCQYIEQTYDRLDLLVNNAAQTVRRPPGFYAHLMDNENLLLSELPKEAQKLLTHYHQCRNQIESHSSAADPGQADLPISWTGNTPGIGLCASARLSQIPYTYDHTLATDEIFPEGQLDADLQQVDLRTVNSWRLRLGEIQTAEMLELQLVNAVAPFVLCNHLAPMMKRDNTGQKHIVNV